MDNQKIVILVLAILLVGAVGYLGYDKWQESRIVKDRNIYGDGFRAGQNQTIVSLFEQTDECKVVPVTNQNETVRLIRVSCLEQSEQAQPEQTQQDTEEINDTQQINQS
ncbi:MAG: hypothetical protein ACOCP4_04770 [Candidatus Woesearchaeota archaeon]